MIPAIKTFLDALWSLTPFCDLILYCYSSCGIFWRVLKHIRSLRVNHYGRARSFSSKKTDERFDHFKIRFKMLIVNPYLQQQTVAVLRFLSQAWILDWDHSREKSQWELLIHYCPCKKQRWFQSTAASTVSPPPHSTVLDIRWLQCSSLPRWLVRF